MNDFVRLVENNTHPSVGSERLRSQLRYRSKGFDFPLDVFETQRLPKSSESLFMFGKILRNGVSYGPFDGVLLSDEYLQLHPLTNLSSSDVDLKMLIESHRSMAEYQRNFHLADDWLSDSALPWSNTMLPHDFQDIVRISRSDIGKEMSDRGARIAVLVDILDLTDLLFGEKWHVRNPCAKGRNIAYLRDGTSRLLIGDELARCHPDIPVLSYVSELIELSREWCSRELSDQAYASINFAMEEIDLTPEEMNQVVSLFLSAHILQSARLVGVTESHVSYLNEIVGGIGRGISSWASIGRFSERQDFS